MTFPVVNSISTSQEIVNTLTHTVLLPPTIASGDFIIIFAGVDGSSSTAIPPTGFTEIQDVPRLKIFTKVADGTEGGTNVTFSTSTSEQSSHACYAGDTWNGNIADIEASAAAFAIDAAPDPSSVTASWGSDDNLFIASFGGARGDRTLNSYPTNYTNNQIFNANGTGTGATISLASREVVGATEDPGAWSISTSLPWEASTVVVRPGAAAAGRIMSSLANHGGLVAKGGIAGASGGLAG